MVPPLLPPPQASDKGKVHSAASAPHCLPRFNPQPQLVRNLMGAFQFLPPALVYGGVHTAVADLMQRCGPALGRPWDAHGCMGGSHVHEYPPGWPQAMDAAPPFASVHAAPDDSNLS